MNMPGLHYDLDSLFPESPDFLQEEEVYEKDYENMRRLYPRWTRKASVVTEEYVDSFEYEGSPIYHEYLDEVTVYNMADDIYYMIYGDIMQDFRAEEALVNEGRITAEGYDEENNMAGWIRDILQVMLCDEIYRRRRRHDRFVKCFKHRKPLYH